MHLPILMDYAKIDSEGQTIKREFMKHGK